MKIESTPKYIRFYLGGVWVLYFNLALAVVGGLMSDFTISGVVYFIAALLAIPVSWFGIALMIVALTVMNTIGKARDDFKRDARIGGWSAVGYAVLGVLNPGYFTAGTPLSWVLKVDNPVTLGVVLLVIHVIVMRRAKALLRAPVNEE